MRLFKLQYIALKQTSQIDAEPSSVACFFASDEACMNLRDRVVFAWSPIGVPVCPIKHGFPQSQADLSSGHLASRDWRRRPGLT